MIRITPSKNWAKVLYWFIGVLLVTAVVFVLLQIVQCHPTSAFWDPKPGTTCWSKDSLALSGYVSGGKSSLVIKPLPVQVNNGE
jgi:hypothetical protein